MKKCSKLMLLLLLWNCCTFGNCQIDVSMQDFSGWAERLGQSLNELSTRVTALDDIRSDYLVMKPNVTEVDGAELISSIKHKLEESLAKKIRSVKGLVNVAQDASLGHKFNKKLKVSYYNSKKLNHSLAMTALERFHNIAVNLNHSTVHVPTNVYDESVEILNGVAWSEKLDGAFKHNHHNDTTTTWQYFCSATGFFRSYPGIEWNTTQSSRSEKFDTFDCRVRDWYLQAAAYPKDLVILLDASGSMRGLRSQIGKATVEKVLDTLNDDDFFNIIKYSDDLDYIRPCFNGTLIQATDNNKIVAKTALEDVQTQGIAMLGGALVEAFELLSKFKVGEAREGVGSSCNQAIMVVTDGVNDLHKDVFEEFNWPNRNVRVFTFLIGREVSDSTNIKWLACNNKGRFAHITSLADVHEHVQEYIHVMSRPMVISRAVHSSWTNVYSDSHEPGLDMMTSISKPVYDIREESLTSGILLGVMGTDVPLKEITKLMPNYKLGVNGFSFAITSNGYALFHPKLKPRQPNLSDYDGAFNAVDLSDLEPLDHLSEMRHRMIERDTGSMKITSFITHDQGKRGRHRESTYYFTDIKHTPFSIGISLPENYGEMRVDGSSAVTKADFSTLRGDDKLIAPWHYCSSPNGDSNLGPLGKLIKILEENQKEPRNLHSMCDLELVQSLLFDAEATKGAVNGWMKENWTSEGENKNGIEVVFIGTKAGLTRFHTFLPLTDPYFLATNYSTIEELYYQRAVENEENVFTFSVPFNPSRMNLKDWVLTASSPLVIHHEHRSAVAAVVGFQIRYQSFYSLFLNATSHQPHHHRHSHNSHQQPPQLNCHSPGLKCFLLDETAYVVVSRNPHDIGVFFGMVPGMKDVMERLIIEEEEEEDGDGDDDDGDDGGYNVGDKTDDYDDDDDMDIDDDEEENIVEKGKKEEEEEEDVNEDFKYRGVFKKLKNIDKQAICQRYETSESAAGAVLNQPLPCLLYSTQRYLSVLLKILLSFFVVVREWVKEVGSVDMFQPFFVYDQAAQNDTVEGMGCDDEDDEDNESCQQQQEDLLPRQEEEQEFEGPIIKTPCTHLHTFYLAKHHHFPLTHTFTACGDSATCSFSVSKVVGTNLLMVVMAEECVCHGNSVLDNKPIELNTGDGCDLLQVNPERRAPDKCFAFNSKENSSQCGGSSELRAVYGIIIVINMAVTHFILP